MAWLSPRTAANPVGTAGALTEVNAADGADNGPVPNWFTAATRNVYDVPPTRPVTLNVVAVAELLFLVTTGVAAVTVLGVATI